MIRGNIDTLCVILQRRRRVVGSASSNSSYHRLTDSHSRSQSTPPKPQRASACRAAPFSADLTLRGLSWAWQEEDVEPPSLRNQQLATSRLSLSLLSSLPGKHIKEKKGLQKRWVSLFPSPFLSEKIFEKVTARGSATPSAVLLYHSVFYPVIIFLLGFS